MGKKAAHLGAKKLAAKHASKVKPKRHKRKPRRNEEEE
jgi:hypothetical protein